MLTKYTQKRMYYIIDASHTYKFIKGTHSSNKQILTEITNII